MQRPVFKRSRNGSKGWLFTNKDEILEDCGKKLDMELNNKYRTRQEIQRLLHY